MFHWLKKRDKKKATGKKEPSDYLKRIKQIQNLSGVTQKDFQNLYVKTIENFIHYINVPNQPTDESVIIKVLDRVVLALKKRQGYLLPLGSDSEIAFRQREEWTFALFVAALCDSIEVILRSSIVKALLPTQAYAWLHRNTELFSMWQSYLKNDIKDNVFAELIEDGTSDIEKGRLRNTGESEASVDAQENKNANVEVVVVEQATQNVLPSFNETDFWEWLKQTMRNNEITYNQADSMVHAVNLGLLIKIPQVIDVFLEYQEKVHGFVSDDFIFQKRAVLTRAIKKHEKLICNSKGSRIHVYCLGKWEERQTLSGIIVEAAFLLDENQTISINTQLTPDPLESV